MNIGKSDIESHIRGDTPSHCTYCIHVCTISTIYCAIQAQCTCGGLLLEKLFSDVSVDSVEKDPAAVSSVVACRNSRPKYSATSSAVAEYESLR